MRRGSGSRACYGERGYDVDEQPVTDGRFNVFAQARHDRRRSSSPRISTACRRSFPAGKSAAWSLDVDRAMQRAFSRRRSRPPNSCVTTGETRIGLLFVVGEERGSDGARVANEQPPNGVRFLINGEPTDNRLGAATRGVLRVRLRAPRPRRAFLVPRARRVGHRQTARRVDGAFAACELPDDPLLGRTHYTVGLIDGGVAPNVVSPHASAELLFRIVGDGAAVREALTSWRAS